MTNADQKMIIEEAQHTTAQPRYNLATTSLQYALLIYNYRESTNVEYDVGFQNIQLTCPRSLRHQANLPLRLFSARAAFLFSVPPFRH